MNISVFLMCILLRIILTALTRGFEIFGSQKISHPRDKVENETF